MKAVMMSIQPKWCELIANGKKTVEVRKTRPKLETPFKCYIYCTNPRMKLVDIIRDGEDVYGEEYHGKTQFIKVAESSTYGTMCWKYQKVIGEFVCDEIEILRRNTVFNAPALYSQSCLTREEYFNYIGNKTAYIWHISELVVYDKPKELSKFEKPCQYDEDCWKCKYYDGGSREEPPSCNWEDFELTRPPQSWCYVEESK